MSRPRTLPSVQSTTSFQGDVVTPGTAAQDGVHFGPTASGKFYVSMYTHRGTRPNKTSWDSTVSPAEEFKLFCCSDDNNWRDGRGHYWSHKDGGASELGTGGERIAKHP